ncbi:DUF6483 family protein [Alkalibaculum bacchi]|uniref:DUF6483 family protein n=1 Tax=Alkalibaculum bacchi TaxID=645887 RepID=UPI0026F027EF|nr:DUF6483 family protein [Alkalibaculum bacchi]
MHYHQDWIMRQIETAVALIIHLITGKKSDSAMIEEFERTTSQWNPLYNKLHELVIQGQICDAEDMLYEAIDHNDKNALKAAIFFYSEINKLSDAELEDNNFPRDEVLSGLQEVCRIYGIQEDLFFE